MTVIAMTREIGSHGSEVAAGVAATLVKDIEFLADPNAGEVRIAAPIGIAAGFVAAVIDRLTLRHPQIVCHLLVGEAATIDPALEERKIDVLVTRLFAPIAEGHFQAEAVFEDPLVVVAAAHNPWSRRRKVELADLMNEPWTLPPPDSVFGLVLVDVFRSAGLDVPRTTVVSSTGVARIAFVERGRFLSMVYRSALRFAGRGPAVKTLPIDLRTVQRPVEIITLKNRTLTPVTQLFIDCAREVAKPLARRK
jgi:DNA-binding transcriptional LysR family regulator